MTPETAFLPPLPLLYTPLRKSCTSLRRTHHAIIPHHKTRAYICTTASLTPTPAPATTSDVVLPVSTDTSRFIIRCAQEDEIYTVADIRCEAFYTPPCPTAQIPVRRREIYTAMRDRLRLGSKCLVVIDTKPPEEYDKFVTTEGLVVGSCDVSLHSGTTGKRYRFGVRGGRGGRKMYVSSMAVRAEWRRRGLAQRLLSYVDVVGGEYGVGEVFLHVEEENGVAVYVYGKCGYERVMCDVPRWVHFLAKREHKLLRKTLG